MKVVLHDIPLTPGVDAALYADGKYAPCVGCFGCWTRHPARCRLRDRLETVCRVIGRADELVIVTENCYGAYSPAVKNVLDRSIGCSTPLSTYRGRLMHHMLRYGRHERLRVIVYGDVTESERETFQRMVKCNAVNYGYQQSEVVFVENPSAVEAMLP